MPGWIPAARRTSLGMTSRPALSMVVCTASTLPCHDPCTVPCFRDQSGRRVRRLAAGAAGQCAPAGGTRGVAGQARQTPTGLRIRGGLDQRRATERATMVVIGRTSVLVHEPQCSPGGGTPNPGKPASLLMRAFARRYGYVRRRYGLTTNHTPPTFWPVVSPGLWSLIQ